MNSIHFRSECKLICHDGPLTIVSINLCLSHELIEMVVSRRLEHDRSDIYWAPVCCVSLRTLQNMDYKTGIKSHALIILVELNSSLLAEGIWTHHLPIVAKLKLDLEERTEMWGVAVRTGISLLLHNEPIPLIVLNIINTGNLLRRVEGERGRG